MSMIALTRKEAMIDLNDERPVVRTSNNKDEKIAENENKAYMYNYMDDMKFHKQRVLTFKENLVKAYGLIWDDYMTITMQNRIEQHPDYASKIKNNPVELMLAIHASMHETVRAQHSILTLFSALTKFFTYKQKEDMSVAEYLKGFKEHRDVFKTQWGTRFTDEYAERQVKYAALTKAGAQNKFKELILEKCIAVLYIMNSDSRQYGTMKINLAASFTYSCDEYPDTLDKAIGYLDIHKLDTTLKEFKKQQHESKDDQKTKPSCKPEANFNQKASGQVCFCCGDPSHKSPDCPYLKKVDKSQWYSKTKKVPSIAKLG
jgi:hypothetical protein